MSRYKIAARDLKKETPIQSNWRNIKNEHKDIFNKFDRLTDVCYKIVK